MEAKALPLLLSEETQRGWGWGTQGSLLAQRATSLGPTSHSDVPSPPSKLVSLPPPFFCSLCPIHKALRYFCKGRDGAELAPGPSLTRGQEYRMSRGDKEMTLVAGKGRY